MTCCTEPPPASIATPPSHELDAENRVIKPNSSENNRPRYPSGIVRCARIPLNTQVVPLPIPAARKASAAHPIDGASDSEASEAAIHTNPIGIAWASRHV